MHRLKAAFDTGLRSRLWQNQQKEALMRAHLLNSGPTPKRNSFGWPTFLEQRPDLSNRPKEPIWAAPSCLIEMQSD